MGPNRSVGVSDVCLGTSNCRLMPFKPPSQLRANPTSESVQTPTDSWRQSDVTVRMRTGVLFNLLGAGFNQGSTLVVNLVVANLLGREPFGRFTMIVATVSMVATLGQLSMGYTATRHVAESRSGAKERASRILGLCAVVSACSALLASVALATGAEWLATRVLDVPALTTELRIAALSVLFIVMNGFFTGAVAGLEGYRGLARTGIISGTAYVVICTALTWQDGLRGAVTGVAISSALQAVLLARLLRREAAQQQIALRFDRLWDERMLVTRFAVPASLTGLVTLPAVWIGSAILARQPNGFYHLGLFGAAQAFRTMVLFVPQAVNNVGMSILNNKLRSTPGEFRQVFWINAGLSAGAAIAVAALLFAAANPLLGLFGPGFRDGRLVVGVLLLAALLEAISAAAYQIIVSRGRMWTSFAAVALPRDLTLVAVAALLVPALGAVGLATAHSLGSALALGGTLIMLSRLGLAPASTGTLPVPVTSPDDPNGAARATGLDTSARVDR
jgi:O-antigen/teichoic acid export membrane protein